MRHLRALLTACAATVLLAAGLAQPAVADVAATSPTYNVITMQGADYITHGTTIFDQSTDGGTFTSSYNIEIHATRASGEWGFVLFNPPSSQTEFAVGHYDVQQFTDDTHASMFLGNNGAGCASLAGSLDIREIAQSGGSTTALAADYAISCDGAPYQGVVRFNSSRGYQVGQAAPNTVSFGSVDEGDASAVRTVVVTGRGPNPLHINGSTTLSGAGASSFSVVSDGCAGQTLATGQTCSVSVQTRPRALGALSAVAHVPDDSIGGDVSIPLQVTSVLGARGSFQALSTARILDTRTGIGHYLGAVGPGSTVHLKVTGVGGVPAAGVSAVVLNLTETGATANGYATAFPAGTTRPTASSINYLAGGTRANLVIAQVGAGGVVELFNCCGRVHLIVDVSGWFAADDANRARLGTGQALQYVAPQRLVDTRQWSPQGLKPGWEDLIAVDYGNLNDSLSAVLVTITAVRPTGGGYLSAYNGLTDPTRTSTVNLQPGVTTPNLAIVPTSICTQSWCSNRPSFTVYNGGSRTTNVLVDIVGVFSDAGLQYGMRYQPIQPTRIVDTRQSLGAAPLGPASTTVVTPPTSFTDYYTGALMTNLTAIKPTASTYLTLWLNAPGVNRPTVSNSNPAAGATVANAVLANAGVDNAFNVYNAAGTTDVAIDVGGTFEYLASDFPAAPAAKAGLRRGRATPPPAPRRPDRVLRPTGPQAHRFWPGAG